MRHQLRDHAAGANRISGLLPHRRQVNTGEGTGIQPELLKLVPDRIHAVDGGEHDPLVAAFHDALDRAVHLRRVTRCFHRNGGHRLRDRTVVVQPRIHRPRLLLGTRNQNTPAVQRTVLPPGVLRAVIHSGTDGDNQGAIQIRIQLAHGAQRCVERTLQTRRAVHCDRQRRFRGKATFYQLSADHRQVFCFALKHERLRGGRQAIPIHRLIRQISLGVRRPQRNTREGRHRRRQRHARHNLELNSSSRHSRNLLHNSIAGERVARDETNHITIARITAVNRRRGLIKSSIKLIDDPLFPLRRPLRQFRRGGISRLHRLTARTGFLRLRAHLFVSSSSGFQLLSRDGQCRTNNIADACGNIRINNRNCVALKHLTRANGQQVRVTWTCTNENDFPPQSSQIWVTRTGGCCLFGRG